jgi:hypothetical protein
MEIWKDINGFEGYYKVSNKGNVFSVRRNKKLSTCISHKGYHETHLSLKGKRRKFKIHRLVANAFIPNPENLSQIDHIDNDKSNNRVENLQWITNKQNNQKKWDEGFGRNQFGAKKEVKKINGFSRLCK